MRRSKIMSEWNIKVEHKYIGKYTVEAETLEDAEEVANGLFFDDLLDNRSTTNKLKETIRIEEYVDD
tara:strand:- start:272 stop:472 length:201 start_codon:yes stop_codon:yes gene_type:complete